MSDPRQTARAYLRDMPLFERINRFIDTSTECWLWTGKLNRAGYASTRVGHKSLRAHRVTYEMWRGPIPAGLHLDHLCRVRHCVRPDHLEPVTSRENWLRGENFMVANVDKTHCKNGHEFTPENTRPRLQGGFRDCRACNNWSYRRAKREALAAIPPRSDR